ncbi:hypothetical protein GobsT_10220 [Gemmata obscuriglobus]|uniref:AbrB/MazE/SpoVT family DNA-binding domain-containing protein n=1 Tax=Gemmata obscuriglobus TaxID=114 RepID=A0A2Z3H7U6_9BACT|nr:hypothetical protein [Gemmata obscuriglobus]AWM40472.1 hypothetical protein C1280_28135 [Gemmata obscuriglobus]QEG26283.1 hypothetical protein GobsT_10220 [Gemmata obscuriglobus]VTS01138.1 unnamed protein product [Gemmata obscuriglobus UQM 2246]
MSIVTRKVDDRVRVVLPANFKEKLVTVEQIGLEEVRVRIVKAVRRRPSLAKLLALMTDENQHEPVDFGPPVGNEVL